MTQTQSRTQTHFKEMLTICVCKCYVCKPRCANVSTLISVGTISHDLSSSIDFVIIEMVALLPDIL